jgi:protein-S-isoprenylcysteine O-methyltransferase
MAIAPIIVAYAVLAGFFVWERGSRRSTEAKSFARGAFDRGSTTLLAAVFSLGFMLLVVSLALNAGGIGRIAVAQVVAWGGIAVMVAGIALRIWANSVLGRFFTRTLRVSSDQRVVSEGPYRLVRHPGYLGDILLWTGAALATLNWIAVICLPLAALGAYAYRISVEEAMLQEALGEAYRAYSARTWRLVPLVY